MAITVTDDNAGTDLTISSQQWKLSGGTYANGLPSGLTLTLAGTDAYSRTWTLGGNANVAAGTYIIKFVATDGQCTRTVEYTLQVNKEALCAEYNGQLSISAVSSSKNSCKASFTLSVGVADTDGTGDVRNLQVQFFVNGQASGAPVTVQSLNSSNTEGNATRQIEYSFSGTYVTIEVSYAIISTFYEQTCGDEGNTFPVNIYLPQNEFITGGGYVRIANSVGLMPATTGRKANFGFNVKYTKSGTNLQGNINYIFRQIDNTGRLRVYQIKGNAMSSLSVNVSNPNRRTAVFNGKCNVSEIVNGTSVSVSGTGNSTMQVILTDAGEPGLNDEYAITVWTSSNELFHSSNWVSTATVKQLLGGGNIQVTGATSQSYTSSAYGIDPSTSVAVTEQQAIVHQLAIKAFPNPTNSEFNVQLLSNNNIDKVQLRVMDIQGRTVEMMHNLNAGQVIQIGAAYRPGIYIVEMIQGNNRKQVKLLKQPH
jgi:hypothetical protein